MKNTRLPAKYEQADLDLAGQIYDAALDPDLWVDVLATMAERIRAAYGVLTLHNLERRQLSFARLYQRDESLLPRYRDHFVRCNPYLDRLPTQPDALYRSQELLSEPVLENTEYYCDWLHPQQVHYHAGAVIFRDPARVSFIEWQRPRRAGAFGKAELEQVARFEPHFKRALLINQKFWNVLSGGQAALDVLEHLEFGVIFLDEEGAIAYTNPKALELTRLGDGLVLKNNRVLAAEPEQHTQLQILIDGAVETGSGQGLHPGGVLWVGTLFDRPYYVLVTPLRMQRNDMGISGKRVCAAVFVTSPYQPYAVSVATFRALHGLTPAETNVVQELANGLALDQIADKLEITKHTVRQHLKSVFSKTHVRRQSELIRLVRSVPTNYVSETILPGTCESNPLEHRHQEDRRASQRMALARPK